MSHQIDNISKVREIRQKETNKNSGDLKYKNHQRALTTDLSWQQTNRVENRSIKIIQFEEQKNRIKKNEQSLRNLYDITKLTDIHIMGALK